MKKERLKGILLLLGIAIVFAGAVIYKKIPALEKKVKPITIVLDSLENYQVLKVDTVENNDTVCRTYVYRVRLDSHYVVKDFNKWTKGKKEY